MVSHWNLSDSRSPQVSRTLLSILADLTNVVVWMVSTRPHIAKSSSPWTNYLLTVPRAPITIGISVTFMFNSWFNSQAKSRYSSLSLSFNLLISTRSGRRAKISWPVPISKFQRSLCISDWVYIDYIQFVRMVKLQFLAQFPMDNIAYSVVYSLILFKC